MSLKRTITSITFLLSIPIFAQIEYQPGYYIDNKSLRTEGFILNRDWNSNPREIHFKKSSEETAKRLDISSVQEFGIGNTSKFIRSMVKIDTSGLTSKQRSPEWKTREIWLRVVIESNEATLYKYEGNGTTRFFYKIPDSDVEQLIYKKYLVSQDPTKTLAINNSLLYKAVNNDYQFQLKTKLLCHSEPSTASAYTYKALKKYFLNFIDCRQSKIIFEEEERNLEVSIAPQIGYEISTFGANILFAQTLYDFRFPKSNMVRYGVEFEFRLPFNKQKWSLIVAPSFKKYDATSNKISNNSAEIKYQAIEFPIGVSYNFPLASKSRIFLRGYLIQDFTINSSFSNDISGPVVNLKVKPGTNAAFSAGLVTGRLTLEGRYYTARSFVGASRWSTEYKGIAFFLGYKLNKKV